MGVVTGYVKGADRDQIILFPESIDDYIDGDNPVKFVDVFVDNLDLVKLGFKYSELKQTGRPPYNPSDILKLYIYRIPKPHPLVQKAGKRSGQKCRGNVAAKEACSRL